MRHTDSVIDGIRDRLGSGDLNDAMRTLVAMHRGRSQDAFAATIGEALMAAELAGRYDVPDPEDGR